MFTVYKEHKITAWKFYDNRRHIAVSYFLFITQLAPFSKHPPPTLISYTNFVNRWERIVFSTTERWQNGYSRWRDATVVLVFHFLQAFLLFLVTKFIGGICEWHKARGRIFVCWDWELLVHICAECLQVNRGDSAHKSGEGPFILWIVPCCHPTICVLWITGVPCFFVHTVLWVSNSQRTKKHHNTIHQLISLTDYSVIYRKFKVEQTLKYSPVLEKAIVRCLFLKDYQWTLCWAISIHSTSPQFSYLRSSLILLSHLRLDICSLIFSAFTTKFFYLGPISFCAYMCPTELIFLLLRSK